MTDTDVQRILKVRGFDTVKAFQKSVKLTTDGIVSPKTAAALAAIPKVGMLTTQQITKIFGQPGDVKNLTTIPLPYPQRIAWDLKTSVTRMQCHRLVAERLKAVYKEILDVYGLTEIQRLGIDLFGGSYVFRQMRGGTSWSRHSWGIAFDPRPQRNTLHETSATARFARPEYVPFLLIWYKHGFCNQGIERGFDFMHQEAVK